jgi:hypothetical protein
MSLGGLSRCTSRLCPASAVDDDHTKDLETIATSGWGYVGDAPEVTRAMSSRAVPAMVRSEAECS